jgi:hypothetical protein
MPGMNGRVLRESAQAPAQYQSPVTSGYIQSVIARHGLLDAGIEFLAKPYSSEVLARSVREVSGRGAHRIASDRSWPTMAEAVPCVQDTVDQEKSSMKSRALTARPDDTIDHVLSLEEGQHFEFKRAGKNERALEAVVAFANAGGGMIFLGIEDPKKATGRERLYGIEENPEAVDDLRRQIRNERGTPDGVGTGGVSRAGARIGGKRGGAGYPAHG